MNYTKKNAGTLTHFDVSGMTKKSIKSLKDKIRFFIAMSVKYDRNWEIEELEHDLKVCNTALAVVRVPSNKAA